MVEVDVGMAEVVVEMELEVMVETEVVAEGVEDSGAWRAQGGGLGASRSNSALF